MSWLTLGSRAGLVESERVARDRFCRLLRAERQRRAAEVLRGGRIIGTAVRELSAAGD